MSASPLAAFSCGVSGAAQFLDGVERLVGSGNRHVILTPYGLRRFVGNGRRNVLPAVVLFLFGSEVR